MRLLRAVINLLNGLLVNFKRGESRENWARREHTLPQLAFVSSGKSKHPTLLFHALIGIP
jgi:hypothetical protein